ncbi:hypothetical protein FRC00_003126 [Tulasnella sp. 408]|nr:hypothetical protein FRC00_003126 [Tulasnella sp. 408]
MDRVTPVISQNVGALSIPAGQTNTSRDIELRPWVVVPKSSEADLEELRTQRIASGWFPERIPIWEEEVRKGTRCIWFIEVRTPTGSTEVAGMVSLNLYEPSDLSLANLRAPSSEAGSRVEGSLLFIYPKYRGRGLWGAVLREVERNAAELGATTVTTHTRAMSGKVQMYERMGYHQYKPQEKIYDPKLVSALGYPEEHCYAAFFEKNVSPPRQYRL